LDFYPSKRELPDGRTVTLKNLHVCHPSKCFCYRDLYTTSVFGQPNDEIEKYLFGEIDRQGSTAIRALVNQDLNELHTSFSKVFEYLDAQKLRTPKGLAWIISRYPELSKIELMLEMQHLRQMHCTMWVEAVREIVSAEDSKVKFIVSDHPVTVYNYACLPTSPQCKYPDDPSIALKASQTIFPLDMDNCLILTNLEYAREQNGINPLSNRTHARYFGQTIARYDTMIRTRKLRDTDVASINFIIKSRAHKFIAAAEKEWLYPEKIVRKTWPNVGKILLPPKDQLYQFGGEIFVGYKDGSVDYQDEYGRTQGELTHLKKEFKKGKVGANDPCTCGSGKKYKKCCRNKSASERPSSEVYSIRERNIILLNAISKILGVKGKSWEDVRRELSDEQVVNIHKVIASLWPKETNIMDLLPHPDSSILRALYTGLVDPRVIVQNVVGFSFYVDEIIVLSPFLNPACFKKEYSPIDSPAHYKQDTIKNVLLLFQLEPSIRAGIVNLIPDPCDFDLSLRKAISDMASERLKNWKPNRKEFNKMEPFFKEDFIRSIWSLPEESLMRQIKMALPQITDEEIGGVLEYMKKMQIQDPLALLQAIEPGKKGGQMQITHLSPNLELGLFLAQVTGSFIYTDNQFRWGEILRAMRDNHTSLNDNWERVAINLSRLNHTFISQADHQTIFEIRRSGRLGNCRKVLRQIWMNLQSNLESARLETLTPKLANDIEKAHNKDQADWIAVQEEYQKPIGDSDERFLFTVKGKFDCRIPPAGFGLTTVYRLLTTHSRRTNYLKSLPIALLIEFENT